MPKTREDLEKAANEFVTTRALNPSKPEVHYNLGLVYFELDEYAEAADCFSEYLRLAPSAEDAVKANTLLATARGLKLWMERARRAMLNPRAWHLLGHQPAEADPDWFNTEFRQTKASTGIIRRSQSNVQKVLGIS